MEVICLETAAFYTLVEEVVGRIRTQYAVKEDKWISGEEAMKKLRISSKTTLQKMRDEGTITFTQPERKIILYDTYSINAYLEKHAKHSY